jgi:integrase
MSDTPYNGYQHLLDLFKQAQKDSPKGVGLKRTQKGSKQYISLQITIGTKRREKSCNCDFTQIGIVTALDKANKVSEALELFTNESDFLAWYETHILDKNVVRNDLLCFKDAIKLVENYYWNHRKKTGKERVKGNPSDETTYSDVYGQYFKLVDGSKVVSLLLVMSAINQKTKGTKTYINCISAFRKLCEISGLNSIKTELDKLDTQQTVFRELQTVSLDEYLEFRDKVLSDSSYCSEDDIESRKRWLFVFSMQVVYGLRISEVFAIQNIENDYTTKDNVVIPKLHSEFNKDMVAVIGGETLLGTSTKTGYRLAIPLIPPTHPYLIDTLLIRYGNLPDTTLEGTDRNKVHRFVSGARHKLLDWGRKYQFITQTHALRHLANLNGMMAGIPLEKRAMSLGHSPEMNDKVYKKRATTKTTLDILTRNDNQAIPLESAIKVCKPSSEYFGYSHEFVDHLVLIIGAIYGVSEERVRAMFKEQQ